MVYKTKCEWCGKFRVCESTTFNGFYCYSCYKVLIDHCNEAIQRMRDFRREEKKVREDKLLKKQLKRFLEKPEKY